MLLTVGVYGRVHFHLPILNAQDPELSARNAPSFREAHNGIVVVAPYPRPVPGPAGQVPANWQDLLVV